MLITRSATLCFTDTDKMDGDEKLKDETLKCFCILLEKFVPKDKLSVASGLLKGSGAISESGELNFLIACYQLFKRSLMLNFRQNTLTGT